MVIQTRSLKEWIEYLLEKLHIHETHYVMDFNPDHEEVVVINKEELPAGITYVADNRTCVTRNGRMIRLQLRGRIQFDKFEINTGVIMGYVKPSYLPNSGDIQPIQQNLQINGFGFLYGYESGHFPLLVGQISYLENGLLRFTFIDDFKYRFITLNGIYSYDVTFDYMLDDSVL